MHELLDEDDANFDELDSDEMSWVQDCLDVTNGYIKDAEERGLPYEVIKEPKLEVVEGMSGHVDWVLIQGGNAFMVDYKFGKNKVPESKDNLQGKAYALGVFNKFGVTTVEVCFVQPKCDFVTTHTFTSNGHCEHTGRDFRH